MEDLETVSNAELQRNFSQFLRTEVGILAPRLQQLF